MIHFDANYLIAALSAGSEADENLRTWVAAEEPLAISVIAFAEFVCGPLSANDEEHAQILFPETLAVTGRDAQLAARLFNEIGRRSRSLRDCLIAAAAFHSDATLATYNTEDFRRFAAHGLRLVPNR